jgi:cytochrome P450
MTATPSELFGLHQDALRCPYPAYQQLRSESPVHFVEDIDAFVVTRHQDIAAIIRQPELFNNTIAVGPPPNGLLEAVAEVVAENPQLLDAVTTLAQLPPVLLLADGKLHSRQRALVNKAFTPRGAASLEPRLTAIADGLIDRFIGNGQAELLDDYATPLPLIIMSELVGVVPDRIPTFKKWADAWLTPIGNRGNKQRTKMMLEALLEFWAYFQAEVGRRRREDHPDLLNAIVNSRVDGLEPLTDAEIIVFVGQLMSAGTETSTKLISQGLLLFDRDPELRDRVAADPDLLPKVIEELLRFEPPVQGMFRVAEQDTTLDGVDIPTGAMLWLAYASANRDPGTWTNPDTFQPGRDNISNHMSFGGGKHYCLGAALARVEGLVGLRQLLTRLDNIQLDRGHRVEYEQSFIFHGPTSLRFTFTPRNR